jgi:DNA-directed RNA polymerase subunit beta
MQRQAVPLLKLSSNCWNRTVKPQVARDSRVLINAEGNGVVEYVDAK